MSFPGYVEELELSKKAASMPALNQDRKSENRNSSKISAEQPNGIYVERPTAEDELAPKTPSGIQKAHKALNVLKYKKHLQAAKTMMKLEEEGESVRAMEFANAMDGEDAMDAIEQPTEQSSFIVKLRYNVHKIISSHRFDFGIGLVIALNSILIGVELSSQLEVMRGVKSKDSPDMKFLAVMEVLCLIAYTVELGLRFFVWGVKCLKSGWVMFDFVLVSVGLINRCIIAPIGIQSDKLAPLLVLRVMRLLRLARAVRLLVQFKTLWMLVRGLLSSALTVSYTCVLVFIIIYVFGCLSIELITKHPMNNPEHASFDEVFAEIANMHFVSLQTSMLTLLQFMFMDSASGIYFPLITRDPQLCVFFITLILIVSISLSNLVTAVIVEGALEQARCDKEAQDAYEAERVKRMIPSLKSMFHNFDLNGDGTISAKEVKNAPPEVQEELMKIMVHRDALEVFEMLDIDKSGHLSIDEFCEGIKRTVTTGDDQVQYMRLHKMVHNVMSHGQDQEKKLDLQLHEFRKHVDARIHTTELHIDHRVQRLEAKLDKVLAHLERSSTSSEVAPSPPPLPGMAEILPPPPSG